MQNMKSPHRSEDPFQTIKSISDPFNILESILSRSQIKFRSSLFLGKLGKVLKI